MSSVASHHLSRGRFLALTRSILWKSTLASPSSLGKLVFEHPPPPPPLLGISNELPWGDSQVFLGTTQCDSLAHFIYADLPLLVFFLHRGETLGMRLEPPMGRHPHATRKSVFPVYNVDFWYSFYLSFPKVAKNPRGLPLLLR